MLFGCLAAIVALNSPLLANRRNAILTGGTAVLLAPPAAHAEMGAIESFLRSPVSDGKVSVAELNRRRAKVGLPALDIIEGDGTWATHLGPFTDSFFDDSFKKRDDGFVYKFVNDFPGAEKPKQGQMVSVYYTGYLEDGTKFDSAYDKGRPFQFRLGKQTVITGWEAVVGGMKLGQKVIVKIPPAYGYGSKTVGPIPPDSNLIFYMELVALGDSI